MKDNLSVTGHCLCGETKYRFIMERDSQPFGYCHCRECRRQYGHYAALTGIKSKYFGWTTKENLETYKSSKFVKRGFCKNCGTPLFFKDERQNEVFISVGTINNDSILSARWHIFVDEKGMHYKINDDLIQYKGDPWHNPQRPPSETDLEKARIK